MGNSPSSSTSQKPHAGQSPAIGRTSSREKDASQQHNLRNFDDVPTRREPNRRESIHAFSATAPKATPAPPSASLASATAQPISSPSHARAISSHSHTRNRSQTVATPRLQPQDMGNEASKPQRASSQSRPRRSPPPEIRTSSPASRPVDVPGSSQPPFDPSPLDPSAPPSEAYHLPPASYSRPPRLPLPIEEEVYTPGSPILSPTEDTAADAFDTEDVVGRRASVISSTLDDEEEPDEFGYMPTTGASVPKVPTTIEWRDAAPDDRVYVTGTFTDWQKKFRLHQNGPSRHKNTMSATLQLPPGTHHVKFLVNNDMVCSNYMPTTVDFTNILVNYIEVVSEKLPQVPAASAPVAVPAQPPVSRPLDIRHRPDAPSPIRTQSPLQQTPQKAAASPKPSHQSPAPTSATNQPRPSPSQKAHVARQPPKQYTAQIPSFLLDLDTWPPPENEAESPDPTSPASRFQRANAAISNLPPPPSLPLFLSKSLLNGTTPMKDDASVLIMPNHTVLNHLATTNIKQGVLATSATTRYKKKFLTTIMYKPRSDDGD